MPSAVPYTPRPFVPDRYEPRGRLGDYARSHGRDMADSIRRGGEISANMWSGIGQNVAGSLRDIAAYPEQQRQAQMIATKQAREEAAYQEQQAAKQSEQAKAQRLQQLVQEHGGQRVPTPILMQEFGPEDAAEIDAAFDELFPKVEPPKPVVVGGRLVNPDGSVVYEPPKEPEKPISVGGRLVKPTGEVVYEPPVTPEKPERPMAVSPGSQVIDPTTGRVIYSSPERPKEPSAPPKMAAGTADKVAMAQTSLEALDRLESIYTQEGKNPAYGDKFIGPAAGRYNAMERGAPGVISGLLPDAPDGFEDFAAETATLKNQVIQAITGAAVGVQEQGRIMAQIPDVKDTPANWKAKAKATRRNLQALMANQIQMGTGAQEPLQPGTTVQVNPTAAPIRVGPYTVRVKP